MKGDRVRLTVKIHDDGGGGGCGAAGVERAILLRTMLILVLAGDYSQFVVHCCSSFATLRSAAPQPWSAALAVRLLEFVFRIA